MARWGWSSRSRSSRRPLGGIGASRGVSSQARVSRARATASWLSRRRSPCRQVQASGRRGSCCGTSEPHGAGGAGSCGGRAVRGRGDRPRGAADRSIEPRDRFAGSVLLLYAQPLTRIARLRTSDITMTDEGEVTIAVGRGHLTMPKPLASIALGLRYQQLQRIGHEGWLLPGRHAGTPVSADNLRLRLKRYDSRLHGPGDRGWPGAGRSRALRRNHGRAHSAAAASRRCRAPAPRQARAATNDPRRVAAQPQGARAAANGRLARGGGRRPHARAREIADRVVVDGRREAHPSPPPEPPRSGGEQGPLVAPELRLGQSRAMVSRILMSGTARRDE
jgi:hypothetical protein